MKHPTKKRLMVVCPGRGSYLPDIQPVFKCYNDLPSSTQSQLHAYLHKIDQLRINDHLPSISQLDQTTFQTNLHTLGEHASTLISTFSMMDFKLLQQTDYDISVVVGNSMGWYITLHCSGVFSDEHAYRVIQTMGSMMKDKIIGGQILYPIVDEEWKRDAKKEKLVLEIMNHIHHVSGHPCYLSIVLGGFLVIGGTTEALKILQKELPAHDRYPMKLINHAAFHTPLLEKISEQAFSELSQDLFQSPQIPMIDGRGVLWNPYTTSLADLYDYTFGHQVILPYDFSRSIEVGLKEFAPDALVLLGPGHTLGGSIAQVLVELQWQGITSKSDFIKRQEQDPILFSMGRMDQRNLLLKK